MKAVTGGRWQEHQPATNTLWLHYLADTLLLQKGVPLTSAQKRHLREFRKRAAAAPSCAELVWDDLFKGLWLAHGAHDDALTQ